MNLPSLSEQRRVAAALDQATAAADEMLARARHAAELVAEIRTAHLQKAFGPAGEIHARLNPRRGLSGMIELRAGGPADFYIQRSGTPENVGRPFREAFPESPGGARRGPGDPRHHIGITVLRTDLLDPRYLYYVAEYAWRTGIYQRLCHGTLQLQHLRMKDVDCGLGAVIRRGPRRNPDERSRELQRQAAAGDVEAQLQLLVEGLRAGRLDYESAVGIGVTYGGPIMDWTPSWEFPGFLNLSAPDEQWNVCLVSAPWWDGGTSFSSLSVALTDMSVQIPLRDLYTPQTGDLREDVRVYREQLAGAITALGMAGASIIATSSTVDQAEQRLTEGLGGGP